MSKPATQNNTAPPRRPGTSRSVSPRMAIHAATGARPSDAPSQTWASDVKRFVQEYPARNRSTGTPRTSGQMLGGVRTRKSPVEATNAKAQVAAKDTTVEARREPAGR